MRRSLVAGALLALPLAALVAAPAQAAPGDGATVVKGKDPGGGFCFQSLVGFTTTFDFVSTESASGNLTLTCHFKDVPYTGKKTQRFNDVACTTFAGFTTNASFVVTPSGQGTLVCKIKK